MVLAREGKGWPSWLYPDWKREFASAEFSDLTRPLQHSNSQRTGSPPESRDSTSGTTPPPPSSATIT